MDLIREWLHLPPRGAPIADQVDALHVFVVSISFAGAALVAVLAIWFAWRYRRSQQRHDPSRKTPVWAEVLGIGALTTLFLVWFSVGWVIYRDMTTPPKEAVDIQVIAKQWMWKFLYPDGRETINELVLPAGRNVRLHLTSRDVIHSLYVPAFRLKRDAMPHATTTLWVHPDRPGIYPLLCTEYCGLSHAEMRGVVRVLAPSDYAAWREGAPVHEDLVTRGRRAAIRHGCMACHTVDGSAHIGPSWHGRFGEKTLMQDGSTVLVDEAYLTQSMMDPRGQIVAGFRDVMPTYQGRLPASDAAAIVAYIRDLQDEPSHQTPPVLPEISEPLRRADSPSISEENR